MTNKTKLKWGYWLVVSALILGPILINWFTDNHSLFLPGASSHGHYQIEMACSACHQSPFGGKEVLQNACMECHGAELKAARDSHPKSKFTDPRNADRLTKIDARYCIACHVEHKPEVTGAMAVTVQQDICFHCHADIAEDRPSHQDMAFITCANGGCHNYHDNTALYEDFLLAHLDEAAVKAQATQPARQLAQLYAHVLGYVPEALNEQQAVYPQVIEVKAEINQQWAHSGHAAAGVNCNDCHQPQPQNDWIKRPSQQVCAQCHQFEVDGFTSGRHGMRLAQGLPPMSPAMARLPMHADSSDKQLTCMSCHSDHSFNTRSAAVESCLNCHSDQHSESFKGSAHYSLWQKEQQGLLPAGSGVSCASCHLPRETHKTQGREFTRVQHNQNNNLRPNEKMIRSVCMQCHGVGFSIDALADPQLILNNFNGLPTQQVESMKMVHDRQMKNTK